MNYLLIVLVTHCLRVTSLIRWFKAVFCRLLSINSMCFVINFMMVYPQYRILKIYNGIALNPSQTIYQYIDISNFFLWRLLTYSFYYMKYPNGNSSTKISMKKLFLLKRHSEISYNLLFKKNLMDFVNINRHIVE